MAFTTIQGSGANDATSFVGTSGVDQITLLQPASNAFVGAQQDADIIGLVGNLNGYDIRGGQGDDTFNGVIGSTLGASVLNGNSNADTITFAGSTSTVYGGQGNDTLNVLTSSNTIINGNKNADQITTVVNGAAQNLTNSSLYGGQGVDNITLSAGTHSNTLISGDNDGDTIQVATGATLTAVSLLGGQGTDNINSAGAAIGATNTFIDGGDGIDTINFANFGAFALNIVGGAGGDIITSGTGNDTIQGNADIDNITNSGGNDTITAGVATDTVALAGTTERVVQNAGDSAAATVAWTNLSDTNTTLTDTNSVITFGNGVDVVTGFNAGVTGGVADSVIQSGIAGFTNITIDDGVVAGTNITNLAAGNYLVQGTWNGNGTFTANDAGLDGLFLQISGGSLATAAGNGTTAIVLDQIAGNFAALVAANFIA